MDPPRPENTDLLGRARAGDAQAFGELFERSAPRLLAYIRLRLSPALAQKVDPGDVLQDTGLFAFQSIRGFESRGPGAFTRWLCAIAENRLRDGAEFHGAQKRRPPGEQEAITLVLDRAWRSLTGPPSAAARDERTERLAQLLEGLEPELRAALVLRFFRGATTAQIAVELGCSESTARRHVARGTAALGRELEEGDL